MDADVFANAEEALAELHRQTGGPAQFWKWITNRDDRLEAAELSGIRWCANCGRDLRPDQRIDAVFCGRSCKTLAWMRRRDAGIRARVWHRPAPAVGDRRSRRFEDWPQRLRDLKERHDLAFTLCHPGLAPGRAPEVCPRWGEPPFGWEADVDDVADGA